MNIVYSGISGLSIIQIDSEIVIVDNELNIYDKVDIDNPFVEPKEIAQRFIKATKVYFKDFKFKQFETLAYKLFAESGFMKETIRAQKELEAY